MNKFVPLFCAAVLVSAASTYAGDGCCPSGKASAKAAAGQCGAGFTKLNLTEEQQAKVAALKAECDKEGCTEASRAKMTKGLEGILNADQFAQWKAMCAKESKAAGCPMKHEAKN